MVDGPEPFLNQVTHKFHVNNAVLLLLHMLQCAAVVCA